jgi:hypothetical protein
MPVDPLVYGDVNRLTESDLTTRTVKGDGIFDGLMASVGAHLKGEFEKNRITGKDYTEAYVALTTAAMSTAVQYLLGTEQAYWQSKLTQSQLEQSDLGNDRIKYEIETLLPAQLAQTQAQTDQVSYQTDNLMPAQLAQIEKGNARLDYELANLLPKQLERATKDIEAVDASIAQTGAQTSQVTYQTTSLLPAQLAQTDAQTAQIDKTTAKLDYEIVNLLPKELEKSNKAIEALTAEISQTTAQKDKILYETASILPAQKAGIEADTDVKVYQLGSLYPAQVAGYTADTATKTYNKDFILPAQKKLLEEQIEAQRSQTLDTRTDGTAIKGSSGKQKELYGQQIESYKRDAETKVVKMLLDGWVTQRSTDEGLQPPTQLADAQINSALTGLRAKLSL